jgi:hypothetical protein
MVDASRVLTCKSPSARRLLESISSIAHIFLTRVTWLQHSMTGGKKEAIWFERRSRAARALTPRDRGSASAARLPCGGTRGTGSCSSCQLQYGF